jgi:tetratricopeptide (TPR) repeat protein
MRMWPKTNLVGIALGAAGLLLAFVLRADEPKPKGKDSDKPPWQRLLTGDDARKAEELQKRIDALFARAEFAEAVGPAEELLRLRQQVQGADHWEAADERWQVKTLRAAVGKPAEQRRQLAETSNNVRRAKALHAKGRYRDEEPLREQVLAIWRQVQGEEHPDTATAYNNLALCQKAQGRSAEAERGYERALAIWRKVYGEEHPHTATAYNGLACCQQDQARYIDAERGFERALAINRKLHGEEHSDTAGIYNNLALCHQDQGRYADAERVLERVLATCRKLLGDEHPHTALVHNNLAWCQHQQGHYAQAERGYERALAIWRKLHGEVHPDMALAYHNLAGCQRGQGRYADAERGFKQALAICRKLHGEEHRDTAASYGNLILCQLDQGHYAEAERGFKQALAICRKLHGEVHPETAVTYSNLAACQWSQGRYAEAERGYEQALSIFRKIHGDEHRHTAMSYSNLALCQLAQGRYDKAEELLTQAAASFHAARLRVAAAGLERAAFTTEHSPLLRLAAVLARNGKPEHAWKRFEKGLARGTGDELAARLKRSPDERQRQTELLARLDHVDRRLTAGAPPNPTPEQEQQRQDLLTQRRHTLDALYALMQKLEQKYGVSEGQVFSLAQVQTRLGPEVALIGWIDIKGQPKAVDPNGVDPKGEHWGVVVRAQGSPAWVRLPGGGPKGSWTATDIRLPGQLREVVRRRPGPRASDWQALTGQVAEQRLKPLAAHLAARGSLPAVRHLVVLPSEQMDGIPLEVLTDRYTSSRAPSATLYAHSRGLPRPESQGLLAVADPVFEPPDTPPAPLPPSGLLLTMVVPGSNAAQAGLKPGDVMLRYDRTKLTRPTDFKPAPQTENAKPTIEVELWREGKSFAVKVRPGKLGVLLADQPAPEAITNQRKFDQLLASRGKDGEDWQPLPGTRVEAEALGKLFRAQKQPVTLLTDASASEPRLAELAKNGELSRFRYLHFATHGTFDPRFPLQSAVILSQNTPPEIAPASVGRYVFDGELTAAEVLENWKLNAELVTLSACETALGKYEQGEGFLGFAQAVLLSGGRSVCLSLWKVDDTATALLMERFYQNLLGQRTSLNAPLPKAQALAEAKAWLRALPREEALKQAARLSGGVERAKGRPPRPLLPPVPEAPAGQAEQPPYAHPFYWATFVLIGDPE